MKCDVLKLCGISNLPGHAVIDGLSGRSGSEGLVSVA
jgi:hypothetical protein